jgi:EAL domain-containing protein (putative c-di-GMP-specific phosphodiesterase class I)
MALHCAAAESDMNTPNPPDSVFSWEAVKRFHRQLRLAADLDTALHQSRFVLHFQPIFDLCTQKSVGAEALLRMRDADGRLLSPLQFLPLAERTGQIVRIGRWVIRQACLQLARWRAQGRKGLRMAVNVSPKQLLDPDFVTIVNQAVEEAGIEHDKLILEVTESEALENTELVHKAFAELAARGVGIAIDDFGEGYSGLSNLLHLPLAILKIDRSLLREIRDFSVRS